MSWTGVGVGFRRVESGPQGDGSSAQVVVAVVVAANVVARAVAGVAAVVAGAEARHSKLGRIVMVVDAVVYVFC